jgi:tetratricopeptide (TPR) repeat protein
MDLRVKTSREGSAYIQKGDFRRAGIFLEIAVRAGNEHPNLLYNLACLYSKARNKKKALDYLGQAVKKGFNDLELIKKDTDLDFIRNEKKFKKIILEINDRL